MEAIEYLPYKIGTLCFHSSLNSNTTSVDFFCKDKQNVVHRVSQIGKLCNKCASLIAKSASETGSCLCCSDTLEQYLKDHWICVHSDRKFDEISIKCLDNPNTLHQVPFKSKVCLRCYDKIRASLMFAKQCLVCAQKQSQTFENLEKTLTLPAYYFFDYIIKKSKTSSIDQEKTREQIEAYCLAHPKTQTKLIYEEDAQNFGKNLEEYHQSKRYQLYPRCQKHRDLPLNLCNNCLVSILNINSCPYGCDYQKKDKIDKKKVSTESAKISETGFVSLYPKTLNNYEYLQYFIFRQIEESGRLDRWEGNIRKIKFAEDEKTKISNKFTLYASAVQVDNDKIFYTGGVDMESSKATSSAFWINFSLDRKEFRIEDATQMEQPRCSHNSVLFNNQVYVIGGFNKFKGTCIQSCEKYNPKTKKWIALAPMKIQRSKPTVFTHQKFIFVVGGLSVNQEFMTNFCERYSPQKNIWETMEYDGYDMPYLNGAATLNSAWGLPEIDNLMIVGGSNYENMTYLVQSLEFKEKSFVMNESGIPQKISHNRCHPSVSLMKTSKPDDMILIIFGGLEEHQSLLSLDAIRIKLKKEGNKTQIIPIFTYEDIQVGSYRLLLRESADKVYEFMMNKLEEQMILTKQKYDKQQQNRIKSEFNTHMIEKMWYGIGKCVVSLNL